MAKRPINTKSRKPRKRTNSKHDGLFGTSLFSDIKIIPSWVPTQRAIWCHIYAACFSVIVLAPLTIMFLDRRQPVELQLVSIEPSKVREGDEVTVTYNANIIREGCGGELLRTIVDSANKITAFVREPTVFNNNKVTSGNITVSKTLIVPRGITPGPAKYVPKIERWCNPLQRYLWPIQQNPEPSIEFTVLP